MSAVAHPETDADLYARLWEPIRAIDDGASLLLDMDPFQDMYEIIKAIKADPVVGTQHFPYVAINGVLCGVPPPPQYQRVTEYHNTTLDHYFLSSTEEENTIIDSGGAGPGWVRTGETFLTIPPGGCNGTRQVFRFYGPGPNSHFFTADTAECGGLRSWDSGWQGEGVAFGVTLPVDGACSSRQEIPVYRFYNNRWSFNDSNHRYTIRQEVSREMESKGWLNEGVAFCVPDGT